MYYIVSVLIFIVSVLLILIVLVQNSKGGGLASGFSASNQFMGVRKTTDFLEKATWTLATSLLVLCLLGTVTMNRGETVKKSAIQEQVESAVDPSALPRVTPQAPIHPATDKTSEKKQ